MALSVLSITNTPITSNCYILYHEGLGLCILVDPGCEDASLIIKQLKELSVKPAYILLTHEHFDHIWSVNSIRESYPEVKVICSKICSELIQDKKQNLSLFMDGIGFEVKAADLAFEDCFELTFEGETFFIFKTAGHSKGSVCIYYKEGNCFFSGDTIIPNLKTVTKIKGGNREDLENSLAFIDLGFRILNPLLYPGHGIPDNFNDIVKLY